ncbi:hypothetical protein [uncultured Roseibium sp.]|uniref:hypothetical protein n=1 Tax=uncultured Roseibium sp. TaxID=1936171 RepID=UPI003216EF25
MRRKVHMTARSALIVGLVLLSAGVAQARPSLYTMTCSEAQAFVKKQGAVVANTGPQTSARIVADGSHCDRMQIIKAFFGKTRDKPQCRIGFRCANDQMSVE